MAHRASAPVEQVQSQTALSRTFAIFYFTGHCISEVYLSLVDAQKVIHT